MFDTIGVRTLQQEHPELDGRTVRLGLVELSQPNGTEGYTFLPNFSHHALAHTDWRNFYALDTDLPVYYSAMQA